MKLSWLSAAVLGAATANAIDTITAVGNKFFTSTGKQFYVKGIAYQLTEGELPMLAPSPLPPSSTSSHLQELV
jgi:hypothetical protein